MSETQPPPRQKGPTPDEDARLAAELVTELAAYAASDAEYTQYKEADDEDLGPPPSLAEALDMLAASGTGAGTRDGRPTLGVAPALIDDMAWLWRTQADLPERVALAAGLWESGVHEAMLAAARMLTQARIRPDDAVWSVISGWAPGLSGAATADAAASAAARRLNAAPARLAEIAFWCASENPWTRRAALVSTLPFARLTHPNADARAARATVLGWCADLAWDQDPGVVRAVGQWLTALAKHDRAAVRDWFAAQDPLPPALRREAERLGG